MSAIEEICEDKGLDKDTVIETVEAAPAAAYRKDYGKPKTNHAGERTRLLLPTFSWNTLSLTLKKSERKGTGFNS